VSEAPSLPNRQAILVDRAFTVLAWLLGATGIALPGVIIGFLAVRGLGVIDWAFLTSPPGGFPLGQAGGIGPALQGSLALVGIGLVVALPLAVGGALFLTEYNRFPALARIVRFATECLAAIPSIVYGLFGYAILVVFMSLKISLLAGGITLGLVMFPLILIGAQEALEAVSWQDREAALSLGVTRAYVVRRVVLRQAAPGILAITTLAAGHAFGSAAPVLFTASVIFSRGGLGLETPVMTLPTHLYFLVGEALSFEHAYGTALVLVGVLLIVNVLVVCLKGALRR
jgi:phosphate transport system permease protein